MFCNTDLLLETEKIRNLAAFCFICSVCFQNGWNLWLSFSVDRLFVLYLAIYNNENLPNIEKLSKVDRNFCQIPHKSLKFAQNISFLPNRQISTNLVTLRRLLPFFVCAYIGRGRLHSNKHFWQIHKFNRTSLTCTSSIV